jgi:hypothetical protein
MIGRERKKSIEISRQYSRAQKTCGEWEEGESLENLADILTRRIKIARAYQKDLDCGESKKEG